MELTDKLVQSYLDKGARAPSVSIYIPTHPKSTSQRINEDRIRFKNVLQKLEEAGAFGKELADTHSKLVRLVDDSGFWLHQSRSLGILADTEGTHRVRLPYELTSATYSGDDYAISPLLIMQSLDQDYYLLDIDFGQPRLYSGNEQGLEPAGGLELPGAIDDVIESQQRRNMSSKRGGTSGAGVTYYGRGEADNIHANDVSRYLQLLANPVNDYLKDKSAPLLIAGSPKVVVEFKSMLSYGSVLDDEVTANYDRDRQVELHKNSLAIMSSRAQASKDEILNRYANLQFDHRADGVTAIETAAERGKVDTLLLPILRITTDGVSSDEQPSLLIELPEDFAPFEAIVRKVAQQGGTIVAVKQNDFADDPSMKAILRY